MVKPPIEPLNPRRDAYLARARDLVRRLGGIELEEVRGILNRVSDVIETQAPNLKRLAALDLDATPADGEAVNEAIAILMSAQHLPRMVICFSRVLLEEEQDSLLTPYEVEAATLGGDLALLTQDWVQRHQELISEAGDEFV